MAENELMNTILRITRKVADMEDAAPESSFMDDLGMGSMDIMELISELEVELGIRIPERILGHIATVTDMYEELGKITASGKS